jgi:predicted ATPase
MRQELDRASVVPAAPSRPHAALPLSVQRPPVLAGRQAAWRELEEAWAAGAPLIFIAGEPGVGKSRLAEEFAERHGRWLRAEGRVGERDVPYAAHTRVLRTLLAQRPDVQLQEWVRRELIRLLPELAAPGELPAALHDERDLLRFYDANFEAMVALHSKLDTVIVDDLQYWDDASSRLFVYVLARIRGPEGHRLPRFIDCYRRNELSAYVERVARELTDAGSARRIELGPLTEEGVRELVAAVGVDGAEAHAGHIARFTGGNPLFVVETLKHLLETHALARGWPERLPPPGKVVLLIQRRLERLSPEALQLARVAALARTQFSLPLAARVLQQPEVALGQAAAELEAALLMVEERFTHDLVHEAVEAGIPAALQRTLHARLAEELAQRSAPTVLQAHHWLAAGVPQRGLALLVTAASAEEEAMLPGEAAALYARAAGLLESAGQLAEAQSLREREAACRRAVQRRN